MIVQGLWFILKCDLQIVDIYFFFQVNDIGKKYLIYGFGGGIFYVSS